MKTLLLDNTDENIAKAAEILRNGGLVGIPTETVYGLAANALDGKAVAKIFAAKGRPADNPLIVHISDFSEIERFNLVREIPETAKRLAQRFWPGPLTMIMKKSDVIPDEVSAGLDTVAIRFPSHPTAQKIIRRSGVPLAAPSANLSGSPSPTTALHVMSDLNGRIDAVVDGGMSDVGLESTVITLAEKTPRVLRPGGITLEQLRSVLGEVELDNAVLHQLEKGAKASSPGMKYKHYAPKAKVRLIEGDDNEFMAKAKKLGLEARENGVKVAMLDYGNDPGKAAHRLFAELRELDRQGYELILIRTLEQRGFGFSVMNRMLKSAGYDVVK